jgi:hypothetical protein
MRAAAGERGGVLRRLVAATRPVVRDQDQLVRGSGDLELLVEWPDDIRKLPLCAVAEDDDREFGCVGGEQRGASILRFVYRGWAAT